MQSCTARNFLHASSLDVSDNYTASVSMIIYILLNFFFYVVYISFILFIFSLYICIDLS